MNKYIVTHVVPGAGMNYDSGTEAVEIEASHYNTQATQGAGLIADFYETGMAICPIATFAQVVGVCQVRTGVFLTSAEARIIHETMTTYNSVEGADAVRRKLIGAFDDEPERS